MIQKHLLLGFLLLLGACTTKTSDPFKQAIYGTVPSSMQGTIAEQEALQTTMQPKSKIALLVPVTGKSATLGAELQNAGMLASYTRPDLNAAIAFFDTKGTPDGAREAYQMAKQSNPSIIIGPVFSGEVSAVKDEGVSVPVLSFTSDTDAIGKGVYTTALLIPNQIERIVDFACQSGQRRIAAIGPENKVGEITMNAMAEAVKKCPGMEIQKVSLYNPKTVNFEPAIAKLAPKPADSKKKNLTKAERELAQENTRKKLKFDSLLVFEEGVQLQQVMSMLSFYDVTPAIVPIYGLSSWATTRDSVFVGGYYPAMPSADYLQFAELYQRNFGKVPSKMASFAYDGVSLAAVLGAQDRLNTETLLTNSGFAGISGRFRLNPDGTNTRLLDMMQIKARGRSVVAQPAPTQMPEREIRPFWQSPEKAEFEVETSPADYE